MKNINKTLKKLAEGNKKYALFNKKIVNTKKEILGVRTPDLRNFAKKLAKEADYKIVSAILKNSDKNIYEEVLLSGLIINYANLTDEQKIQLTKNYLKNVDSWGLIDSFVSTNKKAGKNLWNFASVCLYSTKEYKVRYGIIYYLANFLNEESIDEVFAEIKKVKHAGYYVKMGLAWLYATAAVKFYKKTLDALKESFENKIIDVWTYNKSLQKMKESFRFTRKQKQEIQAMKAL
jgi:hypothetical protein